MSGKRKRLNGFNSLKALGAFIFLIILIQWQPCAGRSLNICDDVNGPLTLDPQKQFSEKNHTLLQQIYEGLIRFDPEGKIEPALALSWERIGDTRMRFKLRENVHFHNGELFDANAVKFSIDRYLDPKTAFPGIGFLDSISGVEIIDSHTVDIITKYPDAILLNRLAGIVVMVPPKYLKERGEQYFAENPIGTGAFIFKEWKKGAYLQLIANKNYWLNGFPKIDGLTFKFIPYDKQIEALFLGEVDLITDLPGTQTLKVMENPKLAVVKKASFYTMPFAFNLSSGSLSNLDVRKALNYAIDKESLIRYAVLGNGQPIATLSMPGETGHNYALQPYEFDPEKAKQLLTKAGYPNGFTLEFLVKKNAERTAKIVATQLKRIGVNLNITLVSDADMLREFQSKKYTMFIGSCPDPLVHSYFVQSIVLFSKSPYAWGGDERFDDMLMKMVTTIEPEKSKKMAEEIDQYVYDNAMSLFTFQKMTVYGYDRGLVFSPYISGMPYFFSAKFSGATK